MQPRQSRSVTVRCMPLLRQISNTNSRLTPGRLHVEPPSGIVKQRQEKMQLEETSPIESQSQNSKVVYRRANDNRNINKISDAELSCGTPVASKNDDGNDDSSRAVSSSSLSNCFKRSSLYERVRDIGSGCFGKAVLVRDKATKKLYVMKIIDITLLGPKETKNAINEVQVLASLRHPYIISYKDSFVENGNLCIVMDYADGGDLYRAIAAYRKAGAKGIPEGQLVRWFTQATLALKYLHDKHILHRDIKSQNLFLMSNGRLRLGDFGIAKTLDGTVAFAKTQVGTPYYLSPEICRNKPYSWAADIWSLGCILFELASLRVPFDAPNLAVLVEKITRYPAPPLPETYSLALRRLYGDCMQRDWQRRPSAADILLREIIQNEIRRMLLEEQQKRHRICLAPALSETSSVVTVSTIASSAQACRGLNVSHSTATTVEYDSQKHASEDGREAPDLRPMCLPSDRLHDQRDEADSREASSTKKTVCHSRSAEATLHQITPPKKNPPLLFSQPEEPAGDVGKGDRLRRAVASSSSHPRMATVRSHILLLGLKRRDKSSVPHRPPACHRSEDTIHIDNVVDGGTAKLLRPASGSQKCASQTQPQNTLLPSTTKPATTPLPKVRPPCRARHPNNGRQQVGRWIRRAFPVMIPTEEKAAVGGDSCR